MRSRAAWPLLAGIVLVSLSVNMAFVWRDVFHRPFEDGVFTGLVAGGCTILGVYILGLERRRRLAADKHNASGG